MKMLPVPSAALRKAGRLDSWYFTSPANLAAELLAVVRARGVRFAKLGGAEGSGRVWAPNRFKRAYAAGKEAREPYLRPHDVFSYLPEAADYLSVARTKKLDSYRVKEGMILQTCSGRNLGPAVLVDKHLTRFVLSHDMLRLEIDNEEMRYYTLAYLKSPTGQAMIRRSKTGSVIDHISVSHLAGQEIPLFDGPTFDDIVSRMKKAAKTREEARLALTELIAGYESGLPEIKRKNPLKEGWSDRSTSFDGRLDAAFYDPLVGQTRKKLLSMGGVPVRDVAKVVMLGRYKRFYTKAPLGLPIISGAQLLQSKPIHPQQILPASFDNVSDYELQPGTIAYPSDGRADEGLGTPVVVTKDRKGWLASNMVGRIFPNAGTDIGWVYIALRSPHAQRQFQAAASGSVIDHTYPPDMEAVVLPPPLGVDGAAVKAAWEKLSEAQVTEDEAVAMMQAAIENPPEA